jgi:hypothetical protein
MAEAPWTLAGVDLPPGLTLTDQEWRFAQSFAQTGQIAPALSAAGWKVPPRDLGKRPGVQWVITELQSRRLATVGDVADRDERRRILTTIARGGDASLECPPSYSDRMKALELLGKMDGDFTEKQEITHVSYVVPMPERILDAEKWTEHAQSVMAQLEHKP